LKRQNRIGISILLLAVLAISLALPVFSALAKSPPPDGALSPTPTSAGATKSLCTGSIGKTIAGDMITLEGILTDDILSQYDVKEGKTGWLYDSGFPWSKENVSFTITKWGEIPQMMIGVEHINYSYPIGGWIMEVKFVRSDLSWPGMAPAHFNTDDFSHNFTRYVWATYSRQTTTRGGWRSAPGGTDKFGNPLNTHSDVYDEYTTQWNEANRVAHGEGSWAGSIQVDDFRLLVNNSRVAVVKTDMSIGFNLTDGIVVGPGWINPANKKPLLTVNLTYVFFKDKKYLVEYKNINCYLPKGYADHLEIQFMQTKQLDTDLGGYQEPPYDVARKTDARFYWDAPTHLGLSYPFGCSYWGNFSVAISELDEAFVPDIMSGEIAHTTYMAFYPRVSNWALEQWRLVNDPTPITNSTGGYTWWGASHQYRENCSDNDYNLIVGAWNFTMETEDNFHLTGVEGGAEWQWEYTETDWCPTDANPGTDGAPEPGAPHNSNFEISWALNETMRPLFKLNDIGRYTWWPFQESNSWTGVYDYCDYPITGDWPWWGGQRWDRGNYMQRKNTAMYIVGETTTIDPYKIRPAATHDTLAAIDIAQSTNSSQGNYGYNCPPPYRSALDTHVSYFNKSRINLYRWHYYYYAGHYYEKPVKVCSMVNETWDPTTSPYHNGSRDKYNVWHIITVGGPDVNTVTNYFNDFGFVFYLGAWPTPLDLMPAPPADAKTPDVLYVPGSKNVYYDYKDDDGACHYFSRISIVHDHNLTREYNTNADMSKEVYPWAALVVDGLMAEGTQMAGSFIAHTWGSWAGWDVRETWDDGAVALVLEFIDYEQDGCIDKTIVVEVVGTVSTSLNELPDVDYQMPMAP
jgi:hypothetical protein